MNVFDQNDNQDIIQSTSISIDAIKSMKLSLYIKEPILLTVTLLLENRKLRLTHE